MPTLIDGYQVWYPSIWLMGWDQTAFQDGLGFWRDAFPAWQRSEQHQPWQHLPNKPRSSAGAQTFCTNMEVKL